MQRIFGDIDRNMISDSKGTKQKLTLPDEVNGTAQERTWTEEIEVSGKKLKDEVKSLAADASVRRVRIKEPDGVIAVDIPLTIGVDAGGPIFLAAPILGAVAGFFAKVNVEIVHEEMPQKETEEA